MLGSTLRLCITEEQCRSNSITPPSSNNQAYPLAMLLSKQNRSIDIIISDGNCFFRAISKELFGEEKHHERLRTILVEYIKLNRRNFQQYMSHGSGSITGHCNSMQKLGVFATQVEIHALSTFLQIPVYIFSKITSSTPWQWIAYKPKEILLYNELHSNLPLQCPPNYHIELCNTNCNHFDRVILLDHIVSEQLNYIHDFPQLSGIDDIQNIVYCD